VFFAIAIHLAFFPTQLAPAVVRSPHRLLAAKTAKDRNPALAMDEETFPMLRAHFSKANLR
jgi:hypothetical protein